MYNGNHHDIESGGTPKAPTQTKPQTKPAASQKAEQSKDKAGQPRKS